MAGRLAAFESQMQERRDERTLGRAEKSGRAALDALDAFRTGEGAIVMNRIRAAARAEPGGIAAVLTEMRAGGRFADLRQQFNNALATERGVMTAYDKAAAALAGYGQDRVGIEQVIARRPDAANLSAKFEQMDAQIGEAAGGTPSRRDGKRGTTWRRRLPSCFSAPSTPQSPSSIARHRRKPPRAPRRRPP
jgi:hypothetical protein